MRAIEAAEFLSYAYPDLDVVVLTRDKYERLLEKAKALDAIKNNLREVYKITAKVK